MKKCTRIFFAILFLLAAGAASCELNIRQDEGGLTAENVNTADLQKAGVRTSQNLFSDFLEMVDNVEEMNQTEIDNMSDHEILELGDAVQQATEKTIYFGDETLNRLAEPLREITENFQSHSESDYNSLSSRIEEILDLGSSSATGPRNKNTDEIRKILKNWASDADTNTACSDLFNHHESYVLIGEGEHFNIANYSCPAGTSFIVRSGVHSMQSVLQSKHGNSWIGLNGAIMDGEDSVYRAFSEGLKGNRIGWIKLRDYHLHGIYSVEETSDVLMHRIKFLNIAPDSSGQDFGAIQFDNSSQITVRDSHFENTASAIRLRFSNGPLEVINNEALNIGRNFFQCDDCNGAGIRINGNSMVRTNPYGIAVLEDWINLYQTSGDIGDWIQVNNNRAKGHSLSGSGSFIMLGDNGGRFQEAVGNIGMNPGQVGIGIAGGHDIRVEANLMYSVPWDSSNVAYYSALYSPSCGNHQFPGRNSEVSQPNRANWMCGDRFNCHNPPTMNYAWTDGKCGITLDEIRNNVQVDRSMGPDVWNEW